MLTVTYGSASAAYQAVATLHQIAEDNRELHRLAAGRIPKNFYVDDLLSGADTIEETKFLQAEISEVLDSGGFVLRKWSTNEPQLFGKGIINEESVAVNLPNEGDAIKALGIRWIPSDDVFYFQYPQHQHQMTAAVRLIQAL